MKDYLRRHIWILSKLYENPKGLTYKEFEYEWGRTELNSLKTPLPKRTFADCLRAIEDAFDIQISSDARNGYRYRIVNREWLEKDNVKDWLLSAFAVKYGNGHLLKILECMKKNQVVNLLYQDFFDDEPCEILLEPYFVRVFHQRWYVIGVMLNAPEGEEPEERTKQGRIRRYALDRVHRIFATEDTFKMPRGLSVDSYFADAFGIIVEPEVLKAERIRIKATDINHRRDYLRKLPIHWSQREVEKHSDYSIFEVTLMPTYDFIQHILSMSSEVEVISPEHVRKEVIRWIKEMTSVYNL